MVIFISAGVLYVTVYMMMLIASVPFGVDATLQGLSFQFYSEGRCTVILVTVTNLDHPEVTLFSWWNIKLQEPTTNSEGAFTANRMSFI